MATRSTITVRTGENERKSIYVHWDGHPHTNGKILLEYYNTPERAEELVSHGDISVLKEKINPETDSHSFDSPEEDVTIYYGRDRGETGVEPQTLTNTEKVRPEHYNYYFDGKEWFVNGGALITRVKLTPQVCEEN